MAINSIKNALWPSVSSANTGNLMLNANDVVYDAAQDIYLNQRTGMIMTGAGLASAQYNPTKPDPLYSPAQRLKVLSLRLRIEEGTFPKSFTDLHTSRDGDTVFVFITLKGKAVTLEDGAALYPSDTLISQIRLLMD